MVQNPLYEFIVVLLRDVEKNPFDIPNKLSNVTIQVEDTLLYVNADILKVFSPVFNAMLSEHFIEGQERKIELPSKKAHNVIRLLRFFYPDRDLPIEDKCDFYSLLSLCEEYQIKWLSEKLLKWLVDRVYQLSSDEMEGSDNENESVNPSKVLDTCHYRCRAFRHKPPYKNSADDSLVMYFLLISERFDCIELKDACRKYCFELEFYNLKKIKVFDLLSKESQHFIYRYCLLRRLSKDRPDCESNDTYDQTLVSHVDHLMEEKAQSSCDCSLKKDNKRRRIEKNSD